MSADETHIEEMAEAASAMVAKMADKLMGRLRVPELPRPKHDLEWPSEPGDLASLPYEELVDHLNYWGEMAAWMRYQYAVAMAAFKAAEAGYEMEYDRRYAVNEDKHVTNKRHETGALSGVQGKRKKAIRLEQYALLLKAVVDRYERRYQTVNKLVTRRQDEYA